MLKSSRALASLGRSSRSAGRNTWSIRTFHVPCAARSGRSWLQAHESRTLSCLTFVKKASGVRWYATDKSSEESQESLNAEVEKGPTEEGKYTEIHPDMWIKLLENTASAEWLMRVPPDPADRLRQSYALLLQIILYLGRPQEADAAQQFLLAFESAPVAAGSEIDRARVCTALITRAIINNISSIPTNSSMRTEHSALFDIFSALLPLHDVYLADGDGTVEEWREFWPRAQPIILSLGMKLDEDGFGLSPEEAGEKPPA